MRSVAGHHIGKVAQPQWVCKACWMPHDQKAAPFYCARCEGMEFDRCASKAEARVYAELGLLVKAGKITELEFQPKFDLYAFRYSDKGPASNREKVGTWRADFKYLEGDVLVVVDVKGNVDTALSKWKHRHFEAQYGIPVTIFKR